MLFRRISHRIREENWLALCLELTMVIAGILLAFQIDRFYEAWQDSQLEDRYLEGLFGHASHRDSGCGHQQEKGFSRGPELGKK